MAASFSPLPPHRVPVFRLWHYPASGPQASWVLFRGPADDPRGGDPRVRRLIWDREADLERLQFGIRLRPSLEPSLERTEVEIDARTFAAILKDALASPSKLAAAAKAAKLAGVADAAERLADVVLEIARPA